MKIFLSYSSKTQSQTDEIDYGLRKYALIPYRDKRNLRLGQNIIEFMGAITEMDYAIMLISPHYLKSWPCLYEFTQYLKKENSLKTIILIRVTDFELSHKLKIQITKYISSVCREEYKNAGWINTILSILKRKSSKEKDWLYRFNQTWDYLVNTKFLEYKELIETSFLELCIFLKIHNREIENKINEILLLKNQEEQDISFERLANKYPENYLIVRSRAIIAFENKLYKKAIFYYEEFIRKFPEIFVQTESYYEIGLCNIKLEYYDEALIAFNKSIAIHPGNFYSYAGMGEVYYKLDRLDQAYDYFSIYSFSPKSAHAFSYLGLIEFKRGNIVKAAEYLNTAIKNGTNEPQVYLNLGACYKKQGYLNQYRKVITEALEKFPDNYLILTHYVVEHSIETEISKIFLLLKLIKKSFRINPNYIDTRMYLSSLLMASVIFNPETDTKKSKLKFAKEILLKSLKMNPTEMQQEYIISTLRLILVILKDNSYDVLLEKYDK